MHTEGPGWVLGDLFEGVSEGICIDRMHSESRGLKRKDKKGGQKTHPNDLLDMRDERHPALAPSIDDAFLAPPVEGAVSVALAATHTWGRGRCRGGC